MKHAIIHAMKSNISITIQKELLDEIKASFPDKNRSQIIEEALEFWTAQKRKNLLKKDANKLKSFLDESREIENENIGDGLSGL